MWSYNYSLSAEPVSALERMTDASRQKLRKHRVAIVDDLDVSDILNDLIQNEVITQNENEIIQSKQRIAKAEYLLDLLPRKGERAFTVFCQTLSKQYPYLQKMLISWTDDSDIPGNLQVWEPNDGNIERVETKKELLEENAKLKLTNKQLVIGSNKIYSECQELKALIDNLQSQQAEDREKIAILEHQCAAYKHDFIAERQDRENTMIKLQRAEYRLDHMLFGQDASVSRPHCQSDGPKSNEDTVDGNVICISPLQLDAYATSSNRYTAMSDADFLATIQDDESFIEEYIRVCDQISA